MSVDCTYAFLLALPHHRWVSIITTQRRTSPVSDFTFSQSFLLQLWQIAYEKGEKKVHTTTYQNSLSYHGSAVNVIRFSPSGELLAYGADGGELIIWKMHNTDSGQVWKILNTLSFHIKDVLDLESSTDGTFLISGSVHNSCLIWDVNKGSVHQIVDAHFHYVQGVAWDPLNKYAASVCSDRTCRIYVKKPQNKTKGSEKSAKHHLFHDETLPSFFRRLSWSPDGSFLLVPAVLSLGTLSRGGCHLGLEESNINSFVEEVLVNGKPWSSGTQEVENSGDKRCGVCGPALIEKFNQEIEPRGLKDQVFVSPCSDAGGHKYAGNLIIYIAVEYGKVSGHWYG
ncbi:hypothetical protein L2E82_14488 [Cichorium intybus]|uniref:Uncharacterized protein n=1 Tax=Cichorium intybus TaxID=13427 RepID=A0ACB9F052_CICIN|nr:hypothetical protein L2E82_14488 [Cichorium intybus]